MLAHDAARVDHGADSRGSRAQHGEAFLDRAHACLREVLGWPGRAEPAVVRGVEDEVRTVAPLDDLAREDDLVTALDPRRAERYEVERSRAGPGHEVDRP